MDIVDNGDGTFTFVFECYDCGATMPLRSDSGQKVDDLGWILGYRGPVKWEFKGMFAGRKQFKKIQQKHYICGCCHIA